MQQQQHIAGSVADAMSVPGAHPTGQANGYQMDASTYAQMAAAQGLSPDQMQAQMMMMTQHGYPMDAATFAQMAALSDPTMMALGGVDPNTLAQMQAFQAAAMGMGGTAGGDYAAQAAAAGYGVPTAVPASAAASDNTSAAAGGGNGGDAGKGVGKRHAWSEEEDNVLLNAVLSLTGTRSEDWAASATPSVEQWNAITDAVPGRNKKQCRERWSNKVNPGIRDAPWSTAEIVNLFRLHEAHGNKWQKIAEEMPGRTPLGCRNCYNAEMHTITAKGHIRLPDGTTIQVDSAALGGGGPSVEGAIPTDPAAAAATAAAVAMRLVVGPPPSASAQSSHNPAAAAAAAAAKAAADDAASAIEGLAAAGSQLVSYDTTGYAQHTGEDTAAASEPGVAGAGGASPGGEGALTPGAPGSSSSSSSSAAAGKHFSSVVYNALVSNLTAGGAPPPGIPVPSPSSSAGGAGAGQSHAGAKRRRSHVSSQPASSTHAAAMTAYQAAAMHAAASTAGFDAIAAGFGGGGATGPDGAFIDGSQISAAAAAAAAAAHAAQVQAQYAQLYGPEYAAAAVATIQAQQYAALQAQYGPAGASHYAAFLGHGNHANAYAMMMQTAMSSSAAAAAAAAAASTPSAASHSHHAGFGSGAPSGSGGQGAPSGNASAGIPIGSPSGGGSYGLSQLAQLASDSSQSPFSAAGAGASAGLDLSSSPAPPRQGASGVTAGSGYEAMYAQLATTYNAPPPVQFGQGAAGASQPAPPALGEAPEAAASAAPANGQDPR